MKQALLFIKKYMPNFLMHKIGKVSFLLAFTLMMMGGGAMGQVTIASDGLNNSTSLFTLSGGLYYTGISTASDGPAISAFASEGSHSRGVINGTATLTSSDINTTGYSSIQMTVRVAAFSIGSTTNGMDASDILTVEVSPNGGTNYYSTCRILGNTNAYWAYSATGNASTAYDGNSTPVDFQPASGGSKTTDGYSTMTITGLPSSTNLRIKITMLNNSSNEQWVIDDFKITGTAAAIPSIAISNGTIAAGSPNNGQTNVILQRYDMAVTTANATFTGLTVTTAGTYAATDLTNLKCWYQSSSTFNSGTATLLSTKTTSLSSGSQVFPSFTSQAITSGSTGYIFVTADIASGATNGNTINIGTTAFSNITFSSGTKTGTDPVPAGGAQTITVAVPDIALSSPAASAANITVGTTNNVIYRFDLAITTATPSLTGVTINTSTGSNASGDLTNLKCWYQTSTTFNSGTATLLSTKTTSLAAGSQVFPTFSSQSLTTGSTYYIFITADVPLTATPNNTIIVSAITISDLAFATGNKTGTANASGTKTIIDCTPADVTSAAASSANLSSVLTWINPACYDEILIVAAIASNNGTPTGDGSAYTSNLAYGSGTALGNGFVVYKGSASSQTVTGLTNGTQYYFKFFTRRGTTWTSGTEVSATPNIAGYYWNGASIAANPAAGGTGTWGTANSWRQPSSSGAQATWADNNNAIFAGTAGTVTLDATRIATGFYFNTSGYVLANSTTQTLTGPIVLGNNVGLTFSPNVNTTTPASGTLNIGSVSGAGTANITISSAQGSSTNIAQRLNIATTNASISVPINITSAGGSGSGTVAAIVGTATGTSLTSAATITNNTAIKTVIGATSGFDITANGVISGSADLMFAAGASGGAGTVTLGAANTYTGATIFNAANSGVVKLGITNALPTATNVTFGYSSNNGGSLDLNGFNQTLASIINGGFGSSVNRIVNNGNTDATLTINGSTSPTAFVFGIQDGTTNKIALVKDGSGTLILDGTTTTGGNTYTGLTTVSGGTLRLNRLGGTTIPITNSVTVSGGTLQISSNQTLAALTVTSGTVKVDAGVTLTIAGNVSIPSGANLILNGILTSTGTRALTIASGANVTIGNASGLSIATGTFSGGKTFTDGANYIFNILTSTPFGSSISNILANNITVSANVTLDKPLSITNSLVVNSGSTLTTGGLLTMKSNASGTARISNSAGTISGDVTVERYIPQNSNRAWRTLSVPTYGSQTIASTWQLGTIITGPASCTGMDVTTNGYSMYTYNASTDNLVGVSSTATAINNNSTNPAAYFLYVRGDRNTGIANSNANPTATTLSTTGSIYQGTVSTDISANNGAATTYHLIGNPYVSPININSFLTNANNANNIENYIYVWDPKMTNTANGVGGILTLTYNGTGYDPTVTGLSYSNGTTELPSGMAFFVQKKSSNCTNCTVNFTESMKSTGAISSNGFKTASQLDGKMQINLGVKINDSTEGVADGLLAIYDAAADAQVVASEDAAKMNNFGESMSIKNGTALLAVEKRPLNNIDTLFINTEGLTNRNYRLVFNPSQFDPAVKAQLIDHYQNLTYPVAIQQKTVYDFTIDANAASKAKDRFELRYSNSSLGIGNTSNIETVSVYPNPTRDAQVFIAMHNQAAGIYQVQIVNAMGITVQQYDMNYEKGMRPIVDLSNAAKGVYYLKLSNAQKEQVVVKIINL